MTKSFTLIIVLFLLGINLYSQDTSKNDSIRQFEEVIVMYQAGKSTPFTFQNISSKEIKAKSTGQEPSFILAETPSIANYSDGGNSQGYAYFRLRGIDQTRINLTLDGVPLNEPEDQGAYFSNYPDILNSVSQIQIQRGVGTSKNGAASYAGSVQLFSPNLKDSSKTTFGLGYGSFNSARAFAEYNSGIISNKAIYVRASQVYSDGYKYHSSNNSKSVFVSTGLFYDKTNWKLNILAGQQENELAWLGVSDSLINIDRRSNANSKLEKDKFFQNLIQLQNSWQISQSSFIQSSAYYTFLKGNYDFDFNNFIGETSPGEIYNYAFQSNLVGFFSNYSLSYNNFSLKTGLHGNLYQRRHIGSEKTLGELYQNTGFKNEASAFTKIDYSVNWLTVFADIQYRYVHFDYQGQVYLKRINWKFLNPKVGLSIARNDYSTFYYSIGSTGREPTRNDMFGGEDDLLADSSGNAILANTKAEYVLNQELGLRYDKNRLHLNLNLYYMSFKNEIILDGKYGPNGLALTNNVEKSLRSGLETTISYKISNNFSLVNNSSFSYSRIKEQSQSFSPILTPPLIINQEIIFENRNLTIALLGRYQHSSFIDFANDERVNGYFLLNSRASYGIKKFQFSFFINNITNAKYYNQGYVDFDGTTKYFAQAPINIYTSIQYSL